MSGRLRTLFVLAEVRGRLDLFDRLLEKVRESDADAVAVVGDLGAPWSKPSVHRKALQMLARTETPAFWVPGWWDGPLREYLPASSSIELVHPSLHAVHGTAAMGPGNVLFAGMGGLIDDDPRALTGEHVLVHYPGFEVERRFKVIDEPDVQQKVFLFATPPAHKGLGTGGSEIVAEVVKSYRPRVAVVAGERAGHVSLGTTLVVWPGRAEIGWHGLVDLHARTVLFRRLVDVREEESLLERAARVLHDPDESDPPRSPEIIERDDGYVLELRAAGLRRDRIEIELVDGELQIHADLGRGRIFDRRIRLPATDAEQVTAKLLDDTLTISMPKAPVSRRGR
jgi:HSP20 family molecular chaperone IbpA